MKFLCITACCLIFSCATTSIQLNKSESRPAITKAEVKRFDKIPHGAEEIGTAHISLISSYGGAEAFSRIRKKAASVGANGFVITEKISSKIGYDLKGEPKPVEYYFCATLFYISNRI